LPKVLQGLAIQKLHGNERLATLLADIVDRADVGMVQGRRCLRFPAEPLQRLPVLGHVFGQELQGHKTVKPGVLGLVDNPHATAPELLDDAVVRDGLANQFRESPALGPHLRVDEQASQRRTRTQS
jgi:hypothetical protein